MKVSNIAILKNLSNSLCVTLAFHFFQEKDYLGMSYKEKTMSNK